VPAAYGGALLVVRPGHTLRRVLVRAIEELQGLSTPLCGVVFNPEPAPGGEHSRWPGRLTARPVSGRRTASGAGRCRGAALDAAALALGSLGRRDRTHRAAAPTSCPEVDAAVDPGSFVPAAPVSPALPATPVVRVPDIIERTGRSDVTATLLGFLHRVLDGFRVVFRPRSRYRVEGTLELTGRSRLVLDSGRSEFFATTVGTPTVPNGRLVGGSDLALRQMIRGPNPVGGTPRPCMMGSSGSTGSTCAACAARSSSRWT
jgi:hypothetical protein